MAKATDLNEMSDSDIAEALSQLSISELHTLEKLIENEEDNSEEYGEISKREISKYDQQDDEDDYELQTSDDNNKKQSEKVYSKDNCKNSNRFTSDLLKRKVPSLLYRFGRADNLLLPEKRIEAKINFLRDKYKRDSASTSDFIFFVCNSDHFMTFFF